MIEELEITKIKLLENIRTRIDESDLSGLMQDIKQHGLLHPIGVWVEGKDYILAFGNRRLECCKKLGWNKIPVNILPNKLTKEDFITINTSENIHRENISPSQFARICKLLKDEGLNLSEIAVKLSVPKTRIITAMRIYSKVPKEWKSKIGYIPAGKSRDKKGLLSASVADRILRLRINQEFINKLFDVAHKEELSIYDIDVISSLIIGGMSFEKAIEKRRDYIVKVSRVAVNIEILNKNEIKNWDNFANEVLRGNKKSIKGLIY